MADHPISTGPTIGEKVWKFFTSVKLTIVVLLSLAATSVIGTLIPQNEDPAAYSHSFGPFLYRFFSVLGLFDMYHSWWFQSLMLLLTINIIVCSIDRLSATGRIIFTRKPAYRIDRFRRASGRIEFSDQRSPQQLEKIFPTYVARHFGRSQVLKTDAGFAVFGEKGRKTRLGVYTVHFSVILLLLGGLLGSIFGFEGYVNIPEGETARIIRLRNSGKMLRLKFGIRCNDFNVSFYDSGAPKEYRSSLTIIKHNHPVVQKDILVNDPLRYEGINIFQSSYGMIAPHEVFLSITSQKTGMVYRKKATIGKKVFLPEKLGTLMLSKYMNSARYKGHDIGAAFIGTLEPAAGAPTRVILPLRFPSFDRMRRGRAVIAVAEFVPRYYTGLQVTRDPGVGVVYVGFILIILGCYITFFTSHQQICVQVTAEGAQSRVTVAGTANKNKLGMQKKIARIAEHLAGEPGRTSIKS